MLSFFKKKTKEDNLKQILKNDLSSKLKDLHISFSFWDRKKVARNKAKNTLFPIALFLERYENVLLNNKQKPGFSTQKALALLDRGQNPIYKKLAIIDSLPLKERLMNWNKDYLKFSLLFSEKSPDKTIYIIRELKEYYLRHREYTSVTSGPVIGMVFNIMFGVFLVIFNVIIIYGGMLDNNTIAYPIFEKYWSWFVKFVTNLFYGTNFIDNGFIKTLAILKSTFFISFVVFILFTIFRSVAETTSLFRGRDIDRMINELWFLKILKIKIKRLEIEGGIGSKKTTKKLYLYQNFIDLLRETATDSLRKGFTNQWFTNDILSAITLYSSFRKFPEKTKLTEGFENLLIMILDGYYAMLNWSNPDFNFASVLEWVESYEQEIQSLQWEKEYMAGKMQFATISNMLTTSTILVVLLMSMSQGWEIERLIKLS